MGWRMIGDMISMADVGSLYQAASFPENMRLKAVRSWLVLFNTPVFSDIQMRIYQDKNGLPGDLFAISSNSWTTEQIKTENHAAKEIYFRFNSEISIRGGETYHFVLYPTDYVGDDSSHLAWVRAWPDPIYSDAISILGAGAAPFKLSFFGVPF